MTIDVQPWWCLGFFRRRRERHQQRAYKLGKKKRSYNQVELTIEKAAEKVMGNNNNNVVNNERRKSSSASATGGGAGEKDVLSVFEAHERPIGQDIPKDLANSALEYELEIDERDESEVRDLSRVRGTDGRDWEGDAEETDERVDCPRRREYVAAGNKREMQQELRRADFKRNPKVRETREDATERGECRGEETDDATRRRQIKLEEFKELVHFYRRSIEPRATVRSEQSGKHFAYCLLFSN